MTDDPDGWRSDRSVMQWVSLFFAEMRWALDGMAQGVPDIDLEELETGKRALKGRIAEAVTRIPPNGSPRSLQLTQLSARLQGEVDAVDSPLPLATATERVGKFVAALDQAVADVAAAAGRRAAATTELAKIKNSPDFQADKRRDFANRRKALSSEIKAALDGSTFDGIDARIQTLSDEVDEQKRIAAAREIAETAVEPVRDRAAELAKTLDRGALLYMNGKVADILKGLSDADDVAKYTKVKTDCDAFGVLAGKAEAYGAYFEKWFKTSAALIATKAVDKPQAWNNRNAAAEEAAKKSASGDFDGAKTELEVFNATPGDGGVGGAADFVATADFIAVITELEASHGAMLEEIVGSQLNGVSAKRKAIAEIRKKGVAQGNVAGATADIDTLKKWIEGNLPLARKLDEAHPGCKQLPEYLTAVQEMEALRTTEKWKDALAKLTALDTSGDLADKIASISVDRKLRATYEALKLRASGGALSGLEKAWNAHHAAVTTQPLDAAAMKSTLATLKEWMKLGEIYDERERVRTIIADHSDAKDYGYADDVNAKFNAKDFSGALAAVKSLAPKMDLLCQYLDTRQEAGLLIQVLPADPPALREQVQRALDDTKVTAEGGDPQKALTDLRSTLDSDDLQALVLAISDYQTRYDVVEKAHEDTLKYMEYDEAKKVINDSLDTARKLAFPGYKFGEAFNALVTHQALLKTGKSYATKRIETKNSLGSLDRAIKQDASWEAQMFTGGKSYAALQTAFDAADAEAKKGNFKSAEDAYKAIIADCTAAMAVAIDLFEVSDHRGGSNAGHSRDSHGAQVSEQEHITRLTTGVAPKNRPCKTNTSSNFRTDSDWLAGREMGAQKAMDAGVDVSSKSVPWPSPQPTNQKNIIEFGRPIGDALQGVRPKQTYDPGTDEFTDTGTYETYEVLTGLTRALVNFTWECDNINGKQVKNLEEYKDEHVALNGVPPATIPGRWVMMQQYPWAEDWNQQEQRYEKPPRSFP